MSLKNRVELVHGLGVLLVGTSLWGGYVYGYQRWISSTEKTLRLQEQLENYNATLRELPPHQPAPVGVQESTVEDEPRVELQPITPTLFLSTLEKHARTHGLRIESSREIDQASVGTGAETTESGTLSVEVTGIGLFQSVIELCESIDVPLPGLEIRQLRVERGTGSEIRWTMVCRNHDGSEASN